MGGLARISGQSTRLIAWLLLALAAGCGGGGGSDPAPAGAGDSTAPKVSGTVNANGATNVSINTMVGATFTEAMDASTITPTTFFLMRGTTPVAGAVSYSGVSAVLAPSSLLAQGTRYTVTLKGGAGGAKDLAGNPLANDHVWSWTTSAGPDTVAPTVSGTFNANGATNVPVNTKVGATFSEAMDPATISTSTFFLTQGSTVVPGSVSYTGVNALFVPAGNLAAGARYLVTVRGGAGGAKDLAGNPLARDYEWAWTTSVSPDTTAPTVVDTVNPNGATNVPINTRISATFSEAMNPLTITANTFILMRGAAVVPGTVSYSGVNAVLIPASNLDPLATYTITVRGGADGASDLAGNDLASDYSWTWTTGATADTTAPMVIGTSVANGATNVGVNTVIAATFSRAMDPLSITNVTCTLLETISGALAARHTVSYFGATVEFKADGFGPEPPQGMRPSTGYTATIKGGIDGATDLAGNPLTSDYVWSFTTGAATQ